MSRNKKLLIGGGVVLLLAILAFVNFRFQRVEGVANAVSGYAGGTAETADYNLVSRGSTGHAEAVEITATVRLLRSDWLSAG